MSSNRLADGKFKVLYNQAFIKLLDIDPEQVAWMAREAGNLMKTEMWAANERAYVEHEELDCWHHDMLLKGRRVMLEGVPYPDGYLTLWIPNEPDTYVHLGDKDARVMQYPDDFMQWLQKSKEELGIYKVGE